MGVVGIGTDIVAVSRIAAALERHGERFAARILSPTELTDWQEQGASISTLAKRFAAKEAAAKALGTGIAQGVTLQAITVDHDALGKPSLHLSNGAARRAQQLGVMRCHLSLSDERDFAVAFVVLDG